MDYSFPKSISINREPVYLCSPKPQQNPKNISPKSLCFFCDGCVIEIFDGGEARPGRVAPTLQYRAIYSYKIYAILSFIYHIVCVIQCIREPDLRVIEK
jgi:hypothetical protein